MARAPTKSKEEAKAEKTVTFEYIKGNFFRVVHADGAIGSITATGNLHIAFFSERPAIPQVTVHRQKDDGSIGEIISEQTISKSTMIREMDVDIIIHPSAIDGLISWLQAQKEKVPRKSEKQVTSPEVGNGK